MNHLPITRAQPHKIRLEAAATCQLKCPSCPTATGAIRPAIRNGFLRAQAFRALLAGNPSLREVELSNYGEVFLNPELPEILAAAHAAGVTLTAHNGVNLNHVRDEVLQAVVRFGMGRITVSIDGTTQAVYERYRVGGELDRVLANIRRINELKRQHHTTLPALTMQFIVFGHNEHQIEEARALAASLDMAFFPKLSWDPDFSPIRDLETVRRVVGAVSRDEYRERNGDEYLIESCHMLWDQPQVNWDGKVLGCCRNHWGDFGTVAFDQPLSETLNGDKLVAARAMLLGQAPARDDVPCSQCDVYQRMQVSQRWLRRGPSTAAEDPAVA